MEEWAVEEASPVRHEQSRRSGVGERDEGGGGKRGDGTPGGLRVRGGDDGWGYLVDMVDWRWETQTGQVDVGVWLASGLESVIESPDHMRMKKLGRSQLDLSGNLPACDSGAGGQRSPVLLRQGYGRGSWLPVLY